MPKKSKSFFLFKDKKGSRNLERVKFDVKKLIFFNFFIFYREFLWNIIKTKVYLLSLQLENNLSFRFQKIFCVIEINKLLDIKGNLTHLKFQEEVCTKKSKSKKKLFNSKLFYHKIKSIFIRRSKVFLWKADPIKIKVFIHKNPLIQKKNFSSTSLKKNYLLSEKKKENFLKKKISFKKFYSLFLPEYFQSKGLFDSTGRRINSFSSVHNQAFYALKRTKGFFIPIKLHLLTFLNEVISFLIDFQTGGNNSCDPSCLQKKNMCKSYWNNFLFLKWKILEEIDTWKKKYSSKIKTLIFLGHVYFSSDHSFEKVVKQIKTPINYTISTCSELQTSPKILKNPFENLNLNFNYFRICLLKEQFNELNNVSYWKIETKKRIDKIISYNSSCIYIAFKYKEIFFKNNFRLYEKNLFVLIWVFFENFNFMLSLFHLYSLIFLKTTQLSIEKLINFIKISHQSVTFKENFIQQGKIKILLKQKKIKFLIVSS